MTKKLDASKGAKRFVICLLVVLFATSVGVMAITDDFTNWNSMTASGWTNWDRVADYSSSQYRGDDYYTLIAKNLDLDSGESFRVEWDGYVTKNLRFEIGNSSTGSITSTWSPTVSAGCQFNQDAGVIYILGEKAVTLESKSVSFSEGLYHFICEFTDDYVNATLVGVDSIKYEFTDGLSMNERHLGHNYARLFLRDIKTNGEYMDNFNLSEISTTPATPSGETPSYSFLSDAQDNINITESTFLLNVTLDSLGNMTDSWSTGQVLVDGIPTYSQVAFYNQQLNQSTRQLQVNIGAYESNTTVNLQVTLLHYNVYPTDQDFLVRFNLSDVYIDTIMPNTYETGYENNTILTKYRGNISGSSICEDTNLYAMNRTIWELNATGSPVNILYNKYVTGINGTRYTMNFSKYLGDDFDSSRYLDEFNCWDSHTNNKVKTPKIKKLDGGLEQVGESIGKTWTNNKKGGGKKGGGFVLDGQMEFYGDDVKDVDVFQVKGEEDRYRFNFRFNTKSTLHELYLTTKELVDYLPKSEYDGHFVYMPLERAIDFVSDEVANVQITEVGEDKYFLSFELYKPSKEIKFKSIFSLNKQYSSRYFNVTEGFTFFAEDFFATTGIDDFTIKVYDGASLIFNETASGYNLTANISSGTYVTNISHPNFAENTTSINYTSGGDFVWQLYASNSLYILLYDEQTDMQIVGNNATIQVINFQNSSYEYSTTTGATFVSGFAEGTYEIRYWAENYTQRSYYTDITGKETQTLRLYVLSSTPSNNEYKNTQILDTTGFGVVNATVIMTRFYTDCNCYRTVEMSKTNDEGQTFLFAQLYDGIYVFKVLYGGVTKKITSETRLDNRDLLMRITLKGSEMTDFLGVGKDVIASLTYDEESGLYTYTWNDDGNTVQYATLKVARITDYTDEVIGAVQVNLSSSTTTLNMSEYINDTGKFIAKGSIGTASGEHVVIKKEVSFNKANTIYQMGGVMLAILIIVAMAMFGAYNPSVSVALCLVGLGFSIYVGLVAMAWTWFFGVVISGIIVAIGTRT